MKMSKKEYDVNEIIQLREAGNTYNQIAKLIGCHFNTVKRYLRPECRQSHNTRHKWVKENKPERHRRFQITQKTWAFQTRNVSAKNRSNFTIEELKSKFDKDKRCYLTGRALSWDNPAGMQFDHINPASRGGTNELSNLGFTCEEANTAKKNKTYEEHIAYCLEVVSHAGYKIEKGLNAK